MPGEHGGELGPRYLPSMTSPGATLVICAAPAAARYGVSLAITPLVTYCPSSTGTSGSASAPMLSAPA